MKFFASVIALLAVFAAASSPLQAQKTTRGDYILEYKDIAIRQMEISGIPASIILAQACLESGDGNSTLALKGNNHFGIKCHEWKGKSIYHDDDLKNECFRKYSKAEDSFKDHSDFLRFRDRYSFLFDLDPKDYKGWAYGLKQAGYATNPQYAQLLIGIIEEYRLYRYDSLATDIPPSPAEIEISTRIHPTKGSPLYKISLYREVFTQNNTAYIIANEYDTYSSLAREYNLFTKEVLRFNDLEHDRKIEQGTIVYVERKKKQSAKHLDKHVFEEGETMYGLSQRFGIRLKYLYKYNNLHIGMEPQPGEIINLRKVKK
jgi:LysM repeat protein